MKGQAEGKEKTFGFCEWISASSGRESPGHLEAASEGRMRSKTQKDFLFQGSSHQTDAASPLKERGGGDFYHRFGAMRNSTYFSTMEDLLML